MTSCSLRRLQELAMNLHEHLGLLRQATKESDLANSLSECVFQHSWSAKRGSKQNQVSFGLANLQLSDLGQLQGSSSTGSHLLVRRRRPFLDLLGLTGPIHYEDRIGLVTSARSWVVDLGVHTFHVDLGAVFARNDINNCRNS